MQKQELRVSLFLFFVAIVLVVGAVIVATKKQTGGTVKIQDKPLVKQDQSQKQTQQSEASTDILSAVSSHNTPQDCWVIVQGNAYNVTTYIDQHPGGAGIITSLCGKDATRAFQTRGGKGAHPSAAMNVLAPLKVEVP